LDFFAVSGTTAAVAWAMGCRFVMVDSSAEAAEVMRARLGGDRVVYLDATGSELEQQIC
jgi:site-specific DNA-methyltransferase (adenine-specific)